MSFDPSLPRDGINVSPTHPLREALVLVAGVIVVAAAVAMALAFIVDLVAPRIPASLEVRLFSSWFRPSFEEGEQRPPRERALEELLHRMAARWPENPYAIHAVIWETAEPNAVALPGGVVAVTTGLLEAVESENELAFVLGHELGHFHNRDHLRGLGRGLSFSLILAVVGWSGSGGAAQLASMAGRFTQRGFDREQETEADRFGLTLLAAEYGHTAGAADLFEHLPASDHSLAEKLSSYLSTHPLHEDRIHALQETTRLAGWSLRGDRKPLPAVFIPEDQD